MMRIYHHDYCMNKNTYIQRALRHYDPQPDGTILRIRTGIGRPPASKSVTTHMNDKGYLAVSLSVAGKKRTIAVHRLVAAKFLGVSGDTVDHINGDKIDNRASNLRYLSRAKNIQEHYRLSEKPANSSIKKDTVREVRARLASGEKITRIANALGMPYSTVYNIKTGKTWSWLS